MDMCVESQTVKLEDVIAGIVTYNPNIDRLKDNLKALLQQVSSLVIVDNGSDNIDEIESALTIMKTEDKRGEVLFMHVTRNDRNEGIAKALWQIMDLAYEKSYKWVLTLDQDSVIMPGLIDEYLNVVNDNKYCDAAMLTCLIRDRNFEDKKYEEQDMPVIEVPYCITAAAFTNVACYRRTGGYNVNFFIDSVDFEICYSIREAGYKIYRVNHVGILHEVGHGENHKFLWKQIVVYNHNPQRVYFKARNTVWMGKRHRKLFSWEKVLWKEVVLILRIILYEDQKIEKIKMYKSGIWSGICQLEQ